MMMTGSSRFVLAILSLCLISSAWAQNITGSGTPNVVPQFTSSSAIGDSPIVTSADGNVGIGGTSSPVQRLEVFDFRTSGGNANGAIFGTVFCTTGNTSPACAGIRGDADAASYAAVGVLGDNFANDAGGGSGVRGQVFGDNGIGVFGVSASETGSSAALVGQSASKASITGLFINTGRGTILQGNTGPTNKPVFRVSGNGTVFADGGFRPFGADFAESLAVNGDPSHYTPGDLLVIDASGKRRLALSQAPYSSLVAGIYSTKPGIVASEHDVDDSALDSEVPLAVVGIVPCKVTTENGPILVGDLLVTSTTPGYAMKGTDRGKMLGAVVGKALEPLHVGKGVVQVLVTLQ